jgi:hypothetical protein
MSSRLGDVVKEVGAASATGNCRGVTCSANRREKADFKLNSGPSPSGQGKNTVGNEKRLGANRAFFIFCGT